MARTLAVLAGLVLTAALAVAAPPLRMTSTDMVRQAESQKGGRGYSLDADSLHSYDQISLFLDYRVEDGDFPLTGHAYITVVGRQAEPQIRLNCQGITVSQVSSGGNPLPFSMQNDTLVVMHAVASGDTVTLDIELSVPVRLYELGFNFNTVPQHHAYSMAEPWGARRWFPCYDQPFDKFSDVMVAVNMPDYWELASNGALVEVSYPSAGRKREVYYHDHPIAPYLVMMAAGNYTRYYQNVNGVEYRYFTFPEHAAFAQYDWGRTPQMVAVFDSLFGPYAFEQYGMVEATIGGAMEHQTFTTVDPHFQTGTREAEGVVAHELAHQWFGDDVTCVDFRNIWLNEGFATYCMSLFYEGVGEDSVYRAQMGQAIQYALVEDIYYLRYPIYDPPDSLIFGSNEYYKGGLVLYMLREQLMGDSLFFAGMRHYRARFAGGNASTQDFVQAMSEVYGQDLQWFFDQWVYQAGFPVIDYTIQSGVPTVNDVTVFVHQTQFDAARHTPHFRFPLLLDVQTSGGTVTRRFWFNPQEVQSVTQSFGAEVSAASLSTIQPLLYMGTPAGTPPIPPAVASRFALEEVYPNPFNSAARIPYVLASDGETRLEVFDLTGRHVQTLAEGRMSAGRHEARFSAPSGMATGVYLILLESGGGRRIGKAMYIK